MSDAGPESAAASELEAEDRARANLYALVGRLFYGPPDSKLLAEICQSGGAGGGSREDGGLAAAWRDVHAACQSAFPAVVRQEYDGLFIGTGKAPVTPYLSAYAEPGAPDRYLVRLREQLTTWGLARRDNVFEVEDHVSGMSDVMRRLIEDQRPLADQYRFFTSFVYPGAVRFCAGIQAAPSASFYKHVADFLRAFLELERAAFEMADTA